MLSNTIKVTVVLAAVAAGSVYPRDPNNTGLPTERDAAATETETTDPIESPQTSFRALNIDESPNEVVALGSCNSVLGTGVFTTKKAYTFSSGQLPSDLMVSSYLVSERDSATPWNHGFRPSNVFVSDGYLNIAVPGRQNPARDSKKSIWGGEVYTAEQGILYGSVRTRAIFDDESGTCQGIFSYHDDENEIDIEYLSNSSSLAFPDDQSSSVLWYTNQPGSRSSQKIGPTPPDLNSVVREYRIDWTSDWTRFYIDGKVQKTLTANVPHIGSQWIWNNWANGNTYWSTGPPDGDSVLKIQSITMYYNTTGGGSC